VKRQFFSFVKIQLKGAGGSHIPNRVVMAYLVEGLDRYKNPNKIHQECKKNPCTCGNVLVKALCYKPEGRGFETG
jgi:hypothetical protein